MSTGTEGASIGYQILEDHGEAGSTWEVYSGPFKVEAGRSVITQAHRLGYLPSDTVSVPPLK